MNEQRETRGDLEMIRRIDPADARRLVDEGRAVLVDTRDRRFYDEAHATGALSVPFAEIRRSPDHPALRTIPASRIIVLYCA
jgi:rhodanese-related sulfurtransferase